MKLSTAATFLIVIIGLVSGCSQTTQPVIGPQPEENTSIHNAFSAFFDVGSAINTQQANGKDTKSLAIINQQDM